MRRAGKRSVIGSLPALSMVLAGAGHTYWMDTLNVITKATTSDFDIISTDLGLYAQHGSKMTPNGWSIVDGIGDKAYISDTFFTGAAADYNKIARDYDINIYEERQKDYNSIEFGAELEKPEAIAKNVEPYNTINTKGSHQINITIDQMHPGYAQAFRTDALNVGNIVTKLSNLKFNVGGLEDSGKAVNILGIALYMDGEQCHSTVDEGKPVLKLANPLVEEGDYFTVDDVDFIRLSALKKLSGEKIRKIVTNVTILCSPATDNRMDLFPAVAIDPDAKGVYTTGSTTVLAKNDDKTSQKKAAEVSIDFLWDQFNVDRDADSPDYLMKQSKSGKGQVPIGLTVTQ